MKNILHFFSDKRDGNIAFHVDDNTTTVLQNHKKLAKKYGYNLENLIHMKQIHSDRVHIVNSSDNFRNPKECDALVTNKQNTPLMVMVADCSPVLFYDPHRQVIAVAHAGRAGAFQNIVGNVIAVMDTHFGSPPHNIEVEIGPSIGVCCYEISDAIAQEALQLGYADAVVKKNGRVYLDIRTILARQLQRAGVEKVTISPVCNCCDESYFSYRREHQTGRFCGVISL